MRKTFAFLLVLVMMVAMTACGATETKPTETTAPYEETTAAAEEKIFTILEAKDCFDDAGFVELIATEAAEYTFTAEDSGAVEWHIYVLDEAFEEGFRHIKQYTEPVLLGDGTIFLDAGKYIYVYCSANEFTTGIVDENAKLNITLK